MLNKKKSKKGQINIEVYGIRKNQNTGYKKNPSLGVKRDIFIIKKYSLRINHYSSHNHRDYQGRSWFRSWDYYWGR
jgi:hypothetical protein